jgi:hypothetical protein
LSACHRHAAASDLQYISNRSSGSRPPVREGSTYFAKPVPEDQASEADTAEAAEKAPAKYKRRPTAAQTTAKRHSLTPRDASSAANFQEELFGPAPDKSESRKSNVVQAGHESANESGKDSQLINAEYERNSGATDRDKIQQVGGAVPARRYSLQNAGYERAEGATERGQIEQIGDARSEEPSLIHADHERQPGHHIEQIRARRPPSRRAPR